MFAVFPKFASRVLAAAAVLAGLSASPALAEGGESFWQGVQKSGQLRCGAAVYAPFVMRDPTTGAYSGFFADLCRQYADVLKVKAVFVDTTWDNIVAGLQAGKWDMSLALNRTPERALAVSFSIPAVQYEVTLAYNKNNPKVGAAPKSMADVDKAGMTVAVTSGTVQDKAVSAVLKQAQVLRLPSEDEARLAVLSKRADLLAGGSDANQLFLQSHADTITTFAPQPALMKQGVAFGFPHQLTYTDIEAFNIFLEQKVATGEINAMFEKSVDEVLKGIH